MIERNTGSESVKAKKGRKDKMNRRMERNNKCRDGGRKGHSWGNGSDTTAACIAGAAGGSAKGPACPEERVLPARVTSDEKQSFWP